MECPIQGLHLNREVVLVANYTGEFFAVARCDFNTTTRPRGTTGLHDRVAYRIHRSVPAIGRQVAGDEAALASNRVAVCTAAFSVKRSSPFRAVARQGDNCCSTL